MESKAQFAKLSGIALVSAALLLGSRTAAAHCDGLDGPVVGAARQALESGNVNHALIWVQKKDEGEVRQAFERASSARKLGGKARQDAETQLFETLVRVHRAGEGEPYTGLKPAGRDLGPALPAADKAIETGKVEPVVKLLTEKVGKGVREQFHEAAAGRKFRTDDVEAGRKHVAAYVEYVHYVERIYDAAGTGGHGEHAGHAAHAEAAVHKH
jgi:hypothetical protein